MTEAEEHRPARRIAFVVANYFGVIDGVLKTTRRLVEYFRSAGDEVRVVTNAGGDPQIAVTDDAILVRSIPLLGVGQPGYRIGLGLDRSARKQLEAFRPDIVHIATPDPTAIATVVWARRRGIPVVGAYHTNIPRYMPYHRGRAWMKPVAWFGLRTFYNRCAHIYVPTQSMLDELRERGFTAKAKLWPRGVDTERFSPAHRSPQWRHRAGIGDDAVVVLFVARLFWEKNVRVLAQALQELTRRGVPHRSVIVGSGPAEDFLRAELPNTKFLGFVQGEELAQAYASSDLFFYPSDTDTFGNVTLEAMASGLPAIVAKAPGSRCLVEDGKSGRIVPAHDPSAFADALEALIRDREGRAALSKGARERAQTFPWTDAFEVISRSYDEILARR